MILKSLLLLTLATPSLAQYTVAASIPLAGSGAWDYLKADAPSRRLYVSHSGDVNVLDLDTLKPVGTLTGFGFIHGILIVPGDKPGTTLGVLSDGQKNNVVLFDPKTLAILTRIPTDPNPNSLAYDAATHRLFVGHKPTKSMTVISLPSGRIETSIPLGGLPEFPIADGHGSIFLNIDDHSEILRIDAASLKITAHWPLAPCVSPSGLAFNPITHRLFAACDNKMLAVVDSTSGKVLATPPIGEGPDAAAYDETRKLIFTSNDDGTLSILADRGADKYEPLQTLPTQKGARTMTLDTRTHTAYLSTAELGPPPVRNADNPNATKHPTSLPNTFHVLVIKPTK